MDLPPRDSQGVLCTDGRPIAPHVANISNRDLQHRQIDAIEDWMDDIVENDRIESWGPIRKSALDFLQHYVVESFITIIILTNMVVMIIETDQTADGQAAAAWLIVFNNVLLVVYSIELMIRMFVWRGQFFFDRWRLLDFFVVGLDLAFVVIFLGRDPPSVSMLRIFRLMKLARAIRAINIFPELQLLLASMAGAFMAMMWGMVLVFVAITIWAIMAVQVIHPVNQKVTQSGFYERSGCERCPDAFKSVSAAALTIWQTVVAGDSWGLLAVPIIEQEPYTALLFVGILLTIGMGIWNLLLAVICEKAGEIRMLEFEHQLDKEKRDFEQACNEFRDTCQQMDTNNSGALSTEELVNGFETNTDFARTMRRLGFSKNNVDVIMGAFDSDSSGAISYDEFAKKLMEARGLYASDEDWMKNLQTMLLYVKVTILEVQSEMRRFLNEYVTDLGMPAGVHQATTPNGTQSETSVVSSQNVLTVNNGDRELQRILRTMTKKIEQIGQEMRVAADQLLAPTRSQIHVEVATISCQAVEANGSANPAVSPTESKRAVAPAPQAPLARRLSRGLTRGLSTASFGMLAGRLDKE